MYCPNSFDYMIIVKIGNRLFVNMKQVCKSVTLQMDFTQILRPNFSLSNFRLRIRDWLKSTRRHGPFWGLVTCDMAFYKIVIWDLAIS